MLYSCTHMATVGVKGLTGKTIIMGIHDGEKLYNKLTLSIQHGPAMDRQTDRQTDRQMDVCVVYTLHVKI